MPLFNRKMLLSSRNSSRKTAQYTRNIRHARVILVVLSCSKHHNYNYSSILGPLQETQKMVDDIKFGSFFSLFSHSEIC